MLPATPPSRPATVPVNPPTPQRLLRPQPVAEIPGTPDKANTPARRVTPQRVRFNLEDESARTPEEPDIVPRGEVPPTPEFQTPDEMPRRPTRERRAPARFADYVME